MRASTKCVTGAIVAQSVGAFGLYFAGSRHSTPALIVGVIAQYLLGVFAGSAIRFAREGD